MIMKPRGRIAYKMKFVAVTTEFCRVFDEQAYFERDGVYFPHDSDNIGIALDELR